MVRNRGRHAEQGLSMVGFLFTAVVVVAVAMIGFRVLPSYVEYYAVQKAMQDALSSVADINNQRAFRNAIEGRLNVNYVDAVKASDIQLKKEGNELVATAEWDRKLHLFANAYILLEFSAEARR